MKVTKVSPPTGSKRRLPNRDLFGDTVINDADPSVLTPRAQINSIELTGACRLSDSIDPRFAPISEDRKSVV